MMAAIRIAKISRSESQLCVTVVDHVRRQLFALLSAYRETQVIQNIMDGLCNVRCM